MTIQQDFKAYGESISKELASKKDRVRNLIGDKHWLTDGGHKEEKLRNVFRTYLPEIINIGKGFVCFPPQIDNIESQGRKATRQIDILMTTIESQA